MIVKKKIHLIECLFSKHGAMTSDHKSISKGLSKYFLLIIYNLNGANFFELLKIIKKIPKDEIIIFLSIKMSTLFLVSFFSNRKFGCVYHFIPNRRFLIHKVLINFTKNVYFSTFSMKLKKILKEKFKIINISFIPNCFLETKNIKKKINKNKFNIFFPKYVNGKNYKINIMKIINKFQEKGIFFDKLFIQGQHFINNISPEFNGKIINLKYNLDFKEYLKILNFSHYMVKFWDLNYEIRCSSTVQDCVKNNIIFYSNYHPVNLQYRLNKTLILNKIIKYDCKNVLNRRLEFMKFYPRDYEFLNYWMKFLNKLKS